MKEKLIEKLLKEQTTPEEEHLIAQMLHRKGHEETDLWLAEDETATYDRLVAKRPSRRRTVRWAVAAVLTVFIAAGAIVLWPHDESPAGGDTIAAHRTEVKTAVGQDAKPAAGQEAESAVGQEAKTAVVQEPAATVIHAPAVAQQAGATRAKSGATRVKARATHSPKAANTTDSLQYYIARLEQELAQVTDSSYTAKAEQIIRADARLQRLVRRIMAGEIERNGQPVEAMANNEGKEDLP